MTLVLESMMRTKEQSILLISENQDFTDSVIRNFFSKDSDSVQTEGTGFHAVNGRGVNLAMNKDVVLFEAKPDNQGEMDALAAILRERNDETVFLGISDSDMSIGKARKFREIGVDDILPITITEDEMKGVISDALKSRRQMYAQSHPAAQTINGTVIAVAQARGGIGSTTYAVNLACHLRGEQKRFKKSTLKKVALVDLDIQFGNANVFLDLEDNGAFQKMAEDGVIPDQHYIQGAMQSHVSGIDLLNAPSAVIPLNSFQPKAIAALVDGLSAQYDFVVIDLPRALVDWLEPVIEKSTQLHLVTDTTIPSIRHAKRLIDFFHETQIGLPIELIVNRETKPFMKSGHCKEAETVLEHRFSHWLPDDPKAARKAVDLGQPLAIGSASSPLSKAYAKIAKSISPSAEQMTQTNK